MWGSEESLRERVATMVPALVLGLAAGVVGGVTAAGVLDTTPYAATDFNTASREARLAGKQQGWREAQAASAQVTSRLKATNAEQVQRLEDKLASTRTSLQKAEKLADDRAAEVSALEASVAEKSAALANATDQGTGTPDGQPVDGTLRTTWVLGPGAKPWPQGCAEPLRNYEVRVTAGEGATVASAELVDAELVRRTEKKRTLTLVCSMTYSATLPTPLGAEYEFAVFGASTPEVSKASKAAPAVALGDGFGPALTVSR